MHPSLNFIFQTIAQMKKCQKQKLKISKFWTTLVFKIFGAQFKLLEKIGVKRGQNFLSTLSLSPVLARRAEAAGADLFIGNSTRRRSIHHRLSHPSRPILFSPLNHRTSEPSSSSPRRSATPPPAVARRRATSTRSPLLRSSSPPTQPLASFFSTSRAPRPGHRHPDPPERRLRLRMDLDIRILRTNLIF